MRQIFINQALGRRQLKEVLSSLLLSRLFSKDELWIVSPWITDFELLDNTANQWNSLVPSFDARYLRFSEILVVLMRLGVPLNVVTRQDDINYPFLEKLKYQKTIDAKLRICFKNQLHTKGVLCKDGFINGSLNLTYSGVESNDETVIFSTDTANIAEALLEFRRQYQFEDMV